MYANAIASFDLRQTCLLIHPLRDDAGEIFLFASDFKK